MDDLRPGDPFIPALMIPTAPAPRWCTCAQDSEPLPALTVQGQDPVVSPFRVRVLPQGHQRAVGLMVLKYDH